MMRATLFLLVLLTVGCGAGYPTGPTARDVPPFYTQPPAPPIFVDLSQTPCVPARHGNIIRICP